MPYTVLYLDMAAAHGSSDKVKLVDPNVSVAEIVLPTMPAGVTFKFAMGRNPLLTLDRPISFQPRAEDMTNDGLFWNNPVARPGVVLEMWVAFGAPIGAAGAR